MATPSGPRIVSVAGTCISSVFVSIAFYLRTYTLLRCVYIYICMCVYTYLYDSIYVYVSTYTYMYMCAFADACVYMLYAGALAPTPRVAREEQKFLRLTTEGPANVDSKVGPDPY